MNKINYNANLLIEKCELDEWERLLESEELDFDGLGFTENSVVGKWSVKFPDGCEVEFSMNTNGRYHSDMFGGDMFAEAVLLDENGTELYNSGPHHDFKGVWNLVRCDGKTEYEYHIEVGYGYDEYVGKLRKMISNENNLIQEEKDKALDAIDTLAGILWKVEVSS